MKMNGKKEWFILIPLTLLILVFGASIPLISDIQNKMERSASKNLINSTYVIENSVTEKIHNDKDSILNFVGSDVQLDSENLKLLRETGNFSQVTVLTADGKSFNCDGGPALLPDGVDANAALLNEEPGITSCYYGGEGRKVIAFTAPVITDGKITAVLFAEREVESYYSDSVFSFYESAGRGYLVDTQTGEFVLKTFQSDGLTVAASSLFETLGESGNNSHTVQTVEQAMADGATGTAQVLYRGSESYVCFTPVTGNENWYLVTIIGETDLMAESIAVRKTIIFMLAIVAAGLIVALAMVYLIAAKSRKEQEQKKRMALLESITSTVAHAFIVYNPAGRTVEYASENLTSLFNVDSGRFRADINNMFDWLGIPAEDSRRIRFLNGTLKKYCAEENQVILKDRVQWIKREVSLGDDGSYITVLTDISREKEYAQTLSIAMENAEKANVAKSEFLSSMSHDIRTPMNGIIGMTAIAAANADDPARVKDCLKKISDASLHLLNLINQVLDMSKIESGKSVLNESEFNLADVMNNLVQMNHAIIENKNQELSIHVTDVRHERVVSDSVKLQQIMTNIVSNANKYTAEGGRIEIGLTEKPGNIKGYGCFEFTCRDSGIGMSAEFVRRIFEPFVRDGEAAACGIQGTGLGMAIVKNIVDMMGGIIKVNSTPGKGTVITVILNLRILDESTEEPLPNLPILVVDDEEPCCVNTVRMLEEIGMKGEWVLTGKEAVEKCIKAHEGNQDYFAVILDWRLPGMDGIETARQIRGRVGPDVPIIILTAYNYDQVEAEAKEAGVTTFLSKPLFKSELYHKLKLLTMEEEDEAVDIRKVVGSYDFQGRHFLLAEDNKLNMEIAVNVLAFTNAEIDSVFNGKEAFDKYCAMPAGYYDLVLMDIQMPVMNGYDATKAVRSSGREDALTVPIIAMTANAFTEDKERAKEAGMDGHIAKPIDIQELILTLSAQLEKTGGKNEQ